MKTEHLRRAVADRRDVRLFGCENALAAQSRALILHSGRRLPAVRPVRYERPPAPAPRQVKIHNSVLPAGFQLKG